jgi:hypothetical protein
MKKQLIGSTALVSAALLAVSVVGQDAFAADPLELSIGGFFQVSAEYRDSDDSSGEPGANLQDLGVYDDGEIQFTASTTLDNGIGVKARIEYEAKNQGRGTAGQATQTDERYLNFSGGFGQLRIGSDDDASWQMQYQAPAGAYQIGVNTPTFAIPVSGTVISSYANTYAGPSGDSQKIIYFSPRMAGFQLGLSYAPDQDTNENSTAQADDDPGQQEDLFSIGLNFVETFGDVDLAIAGGYTQGNLERQKNTLTTVDFTFVTVNSNISIEVCSVIDPTFPCKTKGDNADDIEEYSVGLNVGFAGFTIGTSAVWSNRGIDNNGDEFTWDAGVTYATGPILVGFTWLSSEVEDGSQTSSGSGSDDELDSALISATYNMGPGVDVWGGLKWFDYQDAENDSSDSNEGYIIAIGSSVSF